MRLPKELANYTALQALDIHACLCEALEVRKKNRYPLITIEGQILICNFRFTKKEIHLKTEKR